MFLLFFLKVMVIITAYLVFFMSSMILLNYLRAMLFIAKNAEAPSPIQRAAKAIVFSVDSALLIVSSTTIHLTLDWQKSLVSGVGETVLQQPIFGVVIVALAIFTLLYVRRLAEIQIK